jgi:hypothetical protein
LTDPTSTRSRRMEKKVRALPISWCRPVRTTRESRREDDHPKTRKKDGPQALGCSRSLGLSVQWSPACGLDMLAAPLLGLGPERCDIVHEFSESTRTTEVGRCLLGIISDPLEVEGEG